MTGEGSTVLGGLRLTLQRASFARSDSAAEDDFRTWALVIFRTNAGRASRFWYSEAESLGKTSVTNGFEPPYNFARQSKDIQLADEALTELINTTAVINVYKGGARDASKDHLIGFFTLALSALVTGSKLKGKFQLQHPTQSPHQPAGTVISPIAYTGSVSAELRPSGPLEEFCLGCRVVELPSVALHNIPKRWRIPEAEWAEADEGSATASARAEGTPSDPMAVAALCDDPSENPHRYVLTLSLPSGELIQLPTGRVRYRPKGGALPESPVAAGAGASAASAKPAEPQSKRPTSAKSGASGASGGGASATPVAAASSPAAPIPAGSWEWAVDWRPLRIFLRREGVEALQAHVRSGGALEGTLRRVLTEVVDDDDPVDTVFGLEQGLRLVEEDYAYRGQLHLVLDALLLAGSTYVRSETDLHPAPEVTEAEKAADAAAKAARDAAWADHMTAKAKAGKGGVGAKKATAKAGKDAAGKGRDTKAGAGAKDAKGAKGAAAGKGKSDAAAAPVEEAAASGPPQHPYVAAGTFAHYEIQLSSALTPRPLTPPAIKLTAADLVTPRRPPLAAPPGLDASQAFRREVANAVVAIAREYSAVLQRLAGGPSGAGAAPGGAVGASASAGHSEEVRRRELLSALKSSGVYGSMKTAFKGAALRIARERFAHMPGAADPAGSAGRDMFVSYLYAYLVGQMHAAVNASLTEAEMAASIASGLEGLLGEGAGGGAGAGAPLAGARGAPAGSDENVSARLRRLALECEFAGRYSRAERMHQSRVLHLEEAAAKGHSGGPGATYASRGAWHEYALFYCRRGAALKALTCLREVLAIDAQTLPALLLAAAVQGSRGQLEEALVYSDSAVAAAETAVGAPSARAEAGSLLDPSNPLANAAPLCYGLHSLLLSLKGRGEESGAALLAAEGSLQQLLAARGVAEDDVPRAATPGAVLLLVARSLLAANLNSLARKALQLAADALADTDAPTCQRADLLTLRGRWFLQTTNALAAPELRETAGAALVSDASEGNGVAAATGAGADASRPRWKSRGATETPLSETAASRGGSRKSVAGGASASNPLLLTALGVSVPIALTSGKAYDGAPVTGQQCAAELERAVALEPSCSEAWQLKAALQLSGLLHPDANTYRVAAPAEDATMGGAGASGTAAGAGVGVATAAIPSPLPGAPDIADVGVDDLLKALRYLGMAAGTMRPSVAQGPAGLLHSLPVADVDDGAQAGEAWSLCSRSGVGGGSVHDDEFGPARLHLQVAALHQHCSTITSEAPALPGSTTLNASDHLTAAREAYLRAAEATRTAPSHVTAGEARAHAALLAEGSGLSATAAPRADTAAAGWSAPKAWAVALLGLGRSAWAASDPAMAEALLSEANTLDNQNPVIWTWLAFLCLTAEPLRDREAAAAVDQALKLGLVGDNSETTVLLQFLADRYRELGQGAVATTLLNRALVHHVCPGSVAHAESLTQAQLALAQALAGEGAAEQAQAAYRRVLENPVPPLRPGFAGAAACLVSLDAARKVASKALAASLTQQGRFE